jgi:hypothetical protein
MTQQEAYIRLIEILQEMGKLWDEASSLAKEHDLFLKSLSYRTLDIVTEDPSRLESGGYYGNSKYKDDDPDYPGQYLWDVWQNSTEGGC